MREAREAFFVAGVPPPSAKAGPKGQFWRTRADDMGVKAVRELLRRNPRIPPDRIGDVVPAPAPRAGHQGLPLGRDVALLAGIPDTVPGFAVDRMCAGALTAVTRRQVRSRSAQSTSQSPGASSTWGTTRWATTSTSTRASSRSG